jgi:hypothetical protein
MNYSKFELLFLYRIVVADVSVINNWCHLPVESEELKSV